MKYRLIGGPVLAGAVQVTLMLEFETAVTLGGSGLPGFSTTLVTATFTVTAPTAPVESVAFTWIVRVAPSS